MKNAASAWARRQGVGSGEDPGDFSRRWLSPRFLDPPKGGSQSRGTQMLAGSCQIVGNGFVWLGGLKGCPLGHGCSSWGSKQLKVCIIQNYNNQRPENPIWCTAPGSWAASHLPGQLPGRWGCCSDSWHILSSRLCHTSLGTPSSVDITHKINKVMFTPLPLFSELKP